MVSFLVSGFILWVIVTIILNLIAGPYNDGLQLPGRDKKNKPEKNKEGSNKT